MWFRNFIHILWNEIGDFIKGPYFWILIVYRQAYVAANFISSLVFTTLPCLIGADFCYIIIFFQLYASVLLKDSLTISKGKSLLEKALKEDPYHLPAVYLLCELYEQVRSFRYKIHSPNSARLWTAM